MDKKLIDNAIYETLLLSEDFSTTKLLKILFYKLFNKYPDAIGIIDKKKYYTVNCALNDHPSDACDDHFHIDYDKFGKQISKTNEWKYCSLDYDDIYINVDKYTLIALCDNYIHIVEDEHSEETIKQLQKMMKLRKIEDEKVEIGILCQRNGGFFVDDTEIDYMEIDVDKTYNDDLPATEINNFIENERMGLMLFYGEPGTGKTTYIRHLIQTHEDIKFIILDSNLLYNITSNSLLNTFINNRDAIYIIEDCEKLLVSRDNEPNPIISAFLNMTDGILANVINCKFICTFNTDLNNIDDAIKRKGRMKLKYEFKKLSHDKVKNIIGDDKDMTIADVVYAQHENDFSKKNTKKIGFC